GVPRAAFLTAHLPHRVTVRVERQGLLEEVAAPAGVAVRAYAVETLQRKLAWDLRMAGDERLVVRLHDGELELEPLRIGEAEAAFVAFELDPFGRQAVVPELDRVFGGDAEDDPVHHPPAGAAQLRV